MKFACLMLLTAALLGCGGSNPSPNPVVPAADSPLKESKATLLASQFGEGVISTSTGTLACANQLCSAEYEKNTTVVLTATPASGWVFSHWTGCASVNASQCTVVVDTNKSVFPYFTKPGAPVINTKVLVLDSDSLSKLVSRVGNVFTFLGTATQLQTVVRGQILVSSDGDGFAVRITNISRLTGSNTVIDTELVGLDEVIDEGVVVKQMRAATPKSVVLPKGVQHRMVPNKAEGGLSSHIDLNIDLGQGTSIKGGAEITWNFDVGVNFGLFTGLKEFKFAMNPVIKPNLTVKLGKSNESSWKELPTIKFVFPGIPVGPIVLVPEASMVYKIEIDGSVSLDFVSSYSYESHLGLQYVRGVGWNTIGDGVGSGTFQPTLSAKLEGKVGVGSKASLKVMGLAGPYLVGGAYLKLSGEFEPLNTGGLPQFCNPQATVDVGAAVDFGGEINVLGKSFGKLEGSLIDKVLFNIYKWPENGSISPSCADKEAPSFPVVSVLFPSTRSMTVAWTKSTDNIKVKHYEIYRNGVKIDTVDSTSYLDTQLQPDKAYCFRVVAVDTSGNRSVASSTAGFPSGNEACGKTLKTDTQAPTSPTNFTASASSTTSIDLSWTAAQDESGIAKYLIVVDDAQTIETTLLTTKVLKLKAGTQYCFKVFAFDAYNNKSTQFAQACATTLAPNLAKWTMRLACQGYDWIVTKDIDLNVDENSELVVTDNATDYSGGAMVYHLYGNFTPFTGSLSASIRWSFENSSNTRLDQFTANLSTGDSGDVNMTQVQVTGCDAKVRFTKKVL